MSNTFLVSLIIPCFNVERYVERCLRSVFCQVSDDVQVIVVDDGSTDETLNVVKCFLKKNVCSNFELIRQENQGLSGARNAGIRKAKGEYIAFLDSDDFWLPSAWATLQKVLISGRYDLIEFNAVRVVAHHECAELDGTSRKILLGVKSDEYYSGDDFQSLSLVFSKNYWLAWARVYRRSLLRNDLFEVGRLYEDMLFTPYQYLKAHHIYSISAALVGYTDNPNSITNNVTPKGIRDVYFSINKRLRTAESLKECKPLKSRLLVVSCAIECMGLAIKRANASYKMFSMAERNIHKEIMKKINVKDINLRFPEKICVVLSVYSPSLAYYLIPYAKRLKELLRFSNLKGAGNE